MPNPYPDPSKDPLIAGLVKQGWTQKEIARQLRVNTRRVKRVIDFHGGVIPKSQGCSRLRLSVEEREEISRMLSTNCSFREIGRSLGRHCSTISREVAANGGKDKYRAWSAQSRAVKEAQRPKTAKLVQCPRLKDFVSSCLSQRHSPRQISKRLMSEFPNDADMSISHEAIYQSLYIQARGALRRELTTCLRTGRAVRAHQRRETRGKIKDMVMISQRPAEVDDRAVPGHWEGDLIVGEGGKSAIGTLVERSTRYVMLMKITDQKAETVRRALSKTVIRLPQELFKTLTWDQGCEMAQHVDFSVDSGVDVYFCDPHSPWQRGSNENTNGLLRQYFPKGTPLSGYSQQHLDAVARELNNRPRETLNWKTPAEKMAELLH